MDTRTEPIRQDIDSIRDSMTDKMSQIESRIKGTVDDTTETLKRSLDVKLQVQEHPWAAFGIALLAGYALGSVGGSDERASTPSTYRNRSDFRYNDDRAGETVRYYGEQHQRDEQTSNQKEPSRNQEMYRSQQQQSSSKGFFDDVMDNLGIELDTLKTAAISSLVGMVRDTVKQNLPGVYDEAERLRSGAQANDARNSTFGATSATGAARTSSNASNQSGAYGSTSSSGMTNNGEGEYYRDADITEGRTPTYNRTPEIYPAGSSESDKTETSTQREIGSNPNYDMIPPARHANPDGRP